MPPNTTRILLVSANKVRNPYPVFPLGLAFLEAALIGKGHEVRIHDQLIHGEIELERDIAWAECIGLSLRNVDNVSAKAPVSYTENYRKLVGFIRDRTSAPVIAGGSAFSIFPKEFYEALHLDYGLTGEAEESMVQLVAALAGEVPFESVPGLIYRRPDGSVQLNPQGTIQSAEIPSPKPSEKWVQAYLQSGGMVNIQTQRGCALRCTYCTYPWIEGRCYRHRNPSDVVSELRHLHACGAKYAFFTDSVFNTSRKHVEAVCQAILNSNLRIEWGCFARPSGLDGEVLDLMIRAGMRHIEFGSDSFSDRTLETYGKNFRFDEILEVSEMAAKRKVNVCHYIIFGGPGETEATIRETIENARLLPDAPVFAFSGMRIYPHTPLYEQSGETRTAEELLEPTYYTPPGLSDSAREELIRECTRDNPNWFLSDHADNNDALTARLRGKGKQGPLWEYLAVSRRLRQELKP